MALFGFRGDEAGLSALIEANTSDVMKRGEGSWLTVAEYAGALLNNGIGNHPAALILAQRAAEQPDLATPVRAAVELVEAAARCGAVTVATQALTKLSETTTAAGTDWALGVEARSRALLAEGPEADVFIARRSSCQAGPACGQNSRVRICYTGNGCDGNAAASMRGRSCVARTKCSTRWACMGSPDGPGRELAATGETARKRTAADQRSAADITGGACRAVGRGRPDQRRHRRPPLHQRQDREIPSGQSVLQAGHQLT